MILRMNMPKFIVNTYSETNSKSPSKDSETQKERIVSFHHQLSGAFAVSSRK